MPIQNMDNIMNEILPTNRDGLTPVSFALMILCEKALQKATINPAPNRHIEKLIQIFAIFSNIPIHINSEPTSITIFTSFLLLLRRLTFMAILRFFIQQLVWKHQNRVLDISCAYLQEYLQFSQ